MRTSTGKFAANRLSVVFAAVSIILLLAVAAACGGDDDNKDGGGGTGTPQATVGAQLQVLDSVPILRNEHDLQSNLEDVSKDGRQVLLVAFAPLGSACGSLVRLSLDGQFTALAKDVSQVSFGLPTGHAIFSPLGDRVAYLAADDCVKRDVATLKTINVASGESAKIADGASRVWSWTADEKILFDKGPAAHPALWEVAADGTAPREVAARDAVDVSQDGRRLVYVESGPTVVFDLGAGNTIKVSGTPADLDRRFLSPDGRRYVYAVLDNNRQFDRLELYDLDSGAVSGAIGADQLQSLNINPPFDATWSSNSAVLFLQGTGTPRAGDAPAPAYALGPDGAVAAKLTTASGGVGYNLASRGALLFYRSGADTWVAVLSGEAIPAHQPEALAAAIRSAFPAPVPLTLE